MVMESNPGHLPKSFLLYFIQSYNTICADFILLETWTGLLCITISFPSRCVKEHQIANYIFRYKVASQETDRHGSHNELLNLIVYILKISL